MECKCDYSKTELAKKVLKKLSIEEDDALEFFFVTNPWARKQKLLSLIQFFLLGIIFGMAIMMCMVSL